MKKFEMLNIITKNSELSMKEKMVAHYFIYKSDRNGICYPSVDTIARACGASERTIQRATKKLEEQQIIIITKRYVNGKQTSNEYKINLLYIEENKRNKEIEKEVNENMDNIATGESNNELYIVTSIEEMIQEFYNEKKEEQLRETTEDTAVSEKNEDFEEKTMECRERVIGKKEIEARITGRRRVPIERVINWKFVHSHKKDRISISLNKSEAKRFWTCFIKGDLYDYVIDYHTNFTYDNHFEGKYIQIE